MRGSIPGWRMIEDLKGGEGGEAGEVTLLADCRRNQLALRLTLFCVVFLLSLLAAVPLCAQFVPPRFAGGLNSFPSTRQLGGIVLVDQNGRLVSGGTKNRLFIPASN